MSTSDKQTVSLVGNRQVTIIGAGPSGSTLARLLQMRGARVQVFELDASPTAREQGGELDLHEDSGQIAMQKAGLMEQFLELSRPEGQVSRVCDKQGTIYMDIGAGEEKITRPEIERSVLRSLLLDSLTPGTVRWGHRLERVERAKDGRPRLIFADGVHVDTDLLFACDGVWSKVRPLVTAIKPRYSGVTMIESRVSSVETCHPELAALIGAGTIMATGENKAIMAQRNGDGHARVYVNLRVPESWSRHGGVDFNQPAQVRETLLTQFEGWSPTVLEMISGADNFWIPRPLYAFPPEQTWQSQADVALLGDAAHVMPPYTGKGANYAMLDAVELAENLTSGLFTDIPTAIRSYDTTMLTRMSSAIAETLSDQEVMISPSAPKGIAEIFAQRICRQRAVANR